jgi:hypothetical protein
MARENFGVQRSPFSGETDRRVGEGRVGVRGVLVRRSGGGRNVSAHRLERRHAPRRHVSALGVDLASESDTGDPGSDGASPYLFNRSRNRFAILAGGNKTEKRRHVSPHADTPTRSTPTRSLAARHSRNQAIRKMLRI